MSAGADDRYQETLRRAAAKIDAAKAKEREPDANVTPISAAFDKAKKKPKKAPSTGSGVPAPSTSSGGEHYDGAPGATRGEIVRSPKRLPPRAPVTALGHYGETCYFLDCAGQYIPKHVEKLGRLPIIKLFGGVEYLEAHWPAFDGKGHRKDGEFEHGKIGQVLIASCIDAGLFNPIERVRGPGAWMEDDGNLVIHCGDILYAGAIRAGTGVRRGMLYPSKDPLPEPIMRAAAGDEGPAAQVLKQFATWNWARGAVDAKLALGWIGAAKLGAAADWRPTAWVTGKRGSGKSTLQKLMRWLLGTGAVIHAEDATRAGIFQRVGHSSLPVALDEIEAKGNNARAQDIIELARIASSGGLVLRGGADGNPSEFTARNCFLFSSILIPPLRQADRSRMAILELNPLLRREHEREPGEDELDDSEDADPTLGHREEWEKVGRELTGRLIGQWPRYRDTIAAYRRALMKGGHDARAADQFGSLGAAFDLLMHDGLDAANAAAWAAMLPASTLAETSGYLSEEEACLMHLAGSSVQIFREGSRGSVSKWLRRAKKAREAGQKGTDDSDENRVLSELGLMLHRDAADAELWWVAVSNTHEALAKIFQGTQWGGIAGAPGTWSQALKRIAGAQDGLRRRIDGQRHYCVAVPWDAFFPPNEREDVVRVDGRDVE